MGTSVKRNCQCLQVFNYSFLNVGSSSLDCASSKPSATAADTGSSFLGSQVAARGHSGVCSRVRFLIQQFLPSQKSRRLPVYDSIKFLFSAVWIGKNLTKKSHSKGKMWHWACGGHVYGGDFANRKCLLSCFPLRLSCRSFVSLPPFF